MRLKLIGLKLQEGNIKYRPVWSKRFKFHLGTQKNSAVTQI